MIGLFASLGTYILVNVTFHPPMWSGTWWALFVVSVCAGIVASAIAEKDDK